MNNDMQLPTQCITEKNKMKKLILGCVIGFLVVVSVGIALLINNANRYSPPPFEKNVLAGEPSPPSNLGYSVTSISNDYRVGFCSNLIEKDSSVNVYFTNPEDNKVWLKLLITNEAGETLAETGLITPGQYIESIKLNNSLQEGNPPVTLKVMAYEPDTYLSAGSANFNTAITNN